MGRQTIVDYEDFLAAIYSLSQKGEKITQASVHQVLGKGSASTINKYYKQWKSENSQNSTLPVILPGHASAQFREIWEKSNKEALQQFEEAKATFELKLSDLQKENELLTKINTELQAQIEEFKTKNSHLKADYQLLNEKWIEEAKQRKVLEGQKSEIEKHYNNYRDEIAQSFNEAKITYESSVGKINQWSQSIEGTFKHSLSELKDINENQRQQFSVKLDSLEVARAKLEEANKKFSVEVARYKATIENLEEQIRTLEVKVITAEGELERAHKLIREKEIAIAHLENKLDLQNKSLIGESFQADIRSKLEEIATLINNHSSK